MLLNHFIKIVFLMSRQIIEMSDVEKVSNLFSWAKRYALRLKVGDYGGNASVIPHFQRMRSIRIL
ncbi:MAG: hypothetical protein CVV49_16315 [Spirochaetae bacterium HGW-Spirochaetae-5]|nr:MAG: hypothetical protein CVV49_16315 [Spirochaetae bacterium HGW-Spirochaetae-5]